MYFTDQNYETTEEPKYNDQFNSIQDLTDEQTDKFYLTEQQKLIILIIAVSLFFITLLITICIVSPCCYISKLIKKWLIKTADQNVLSPSNPILKQYISPDSKSFQLTVVPQYIEKQKLDLNLSKNDKLNLLNQQNEPINLYNNNLNDNKRKLLLKDIFQNKEINCNTFFLNNKNLNNDDVYDKFNNNLNDFKFYDNNFIYNDLNTFTTTNNNQSNNDEMEIICSLRTQKYLNTQTKLNNLRLTLILKQIKNLPLKSNGLEPAFFVNVSITNLNTNSTFRKVNRKLNTKLTNQLNFNSETFKPRTLSPMLNLRYYFDELTKNLIKDAKLLIRIIAVEKHANDHCLGELMINIKQILNDEKIIEKNSFNEKEDIYKCYKIQKPKKEIKGELLMTICYLPTSKRATFNFSKANLSNQLINILDFNQNYFVRVIMISSNGKLIKKKKTCSSNKLDLNDETLTFDLTNLNGYQLEQLCFLVVLCCTQETITEVISSPSSPDSPVENNYNNFIKRNSTIEEEIKRKVDKNLQKKDNIPIGHFMLSSDMWAQITNEPRKQIKKWVKLI